MGMELRALTWNLFHGRDHPPDRRARQLALAPAADHGAKRHPRPGQPRPASTSSPACSPRPTGTSPCSRSVRRAGPPRSPRPPAPTLTACSPPATRSRPLRALLARINPDLIASNEGGSNLTLVRGRDPRAARARAHPGPAPRAPGDGVHTRASPDRFGVELCVANLHASAGPGRRADAEREVLLAAERAREWAGKTPLRVRRRPQPAPARDRPSSSNWRRASGFARPTGPGVARPPARRRPRGRRAADRVAARAARGRRGRTGDHALRPRAGAGNVRRAATRWRPGEPRDVR